MSNPFQVVHDFEAAVCEYTGAPYCVTTNSCTMALLLAAAWCRDRYNAPANMWADPIIEIPKKTYVGVPMSIINARCSVSFRHEEWLGDYQLKPYPIWDSARYFSADMYASGRFVCVSFHHSKILGDSQGGAILHDNSEADAWFRRARFDGRTEGVPPKEDTFACLSPHRGVRQSHNFVGWHCYISPDVASRLLWKLSRLPKVNKPLPNDDYPELDKMEVFR